MPESFGTLIPEQLATNEFELLRAELPHFATYVDLPLHHRDPFDRLLIAQAKTENLQIVGKDKEFEAYGVELLW